MHRAVTEETLTAVSLVFDTGSGAREAGLAITQQVTRQPLPLSVPECCFLIPGTELGKEVISGGAAVPACGSSQSSGPWGHRESAR